MRQPLPSSRPRFSPAFLKRLSSHLVLATTLIAVAARAPGLAQAVLVFLAVQLALAVFSRADYLFTSMALTRSGPMPSDVSVMAQALFLPYWFWGAVCGALSVGILFLGLKFFFHPHGSRTPAAPALIR